MISYNEMNTESGGGKTLSSNWDNRLRGVDYGTGSSAFKYDPLGNRVWKQTTVGAVVSSRKYIVDIVGDLPVILMEFDTADSSIMKTYIYGNSQIIAQHDGDHTAAKYFYLHDRLGSVRLLADTAGDGQNFTL